MPAHSKKLLYLDQILQRYQAGETLMAIAEDLPVHYNTVIEWFKEEGIEVRKKGIAHRGRTVTLFEYVCDWDGCKKPFTSQKTDARFCSRACTHEWERAHAEESFAEVLCPCGKTFRGRRSRMRKFCSEECRGKYQDRRQKNPDKYRVFVCENPLCGKEVTRLKRLGSRFCSNECAAKFNKATHHVVDMETSTVLDSSWEALFWGLCRFYKVQVKRVDRAEAIEWAPGSWYAPDFNVGDTYIEVKGLEDDDDPRKWAAWARQGRLVVLDKAKLKVLLRCEDGSALYTRLTGQTP